MITVKFSNVGREKLTWTADLEELDHELLWSQAKSRGKLMSNDIEFSQTGDSPIGGSILAGYHKVGTWEVVAADD